jgi:hypothetical protein
MSVKKPVRSNVKNKKCNKEVVKPIEYDDHLSSRKAKDLANRQYHKEWYRRKMMDPEYVRWRKEKNILYRNDPKNRERKKKRGKELYLMNKNNPEYMRRLYLKKRDPEYLKVKRARYREWYHNTIKNNPNFLKHKRDTARERYNRDPELRAKSRVYHTRRYRLSRLNKRLCKIMVSLPKINRIISLNKGE